MIFYSFVPNIRLTKRLHKRDGYFEISTKIASSSTSLSYWLYLKCVIGGFHMSCGNITVTPGDILTFYSILTLLKAL